MARATRSRSELNRRNDARVFAREQVGDFEARGDIDALGPRVALLGEAGILMAGSGHGGSVPS